MRDSVGGTFMIYVLIVFLAVYIVFVAVAFNYARAFRVKDKIMDIIEQNEGISDFSNTSGEIGQIESYLNKISYRVNGISESNCNGFDYINEDRGYCIAKIDQNSSIDGITSSYYKVRTFVYIEFPFLKLQFTIPINGETRRVHKITS